MTTLILRRCGAILLAGGLLLAVAYLFYPSSARSDLIRPVAAIGLVGVLLLLPALIAFQVVQAGRTRIAGWLGVTLTAVGIGALEIPHMVFGAFDPHRLYDLDAYHSGPFGAAAFYGGIALGVGLVVLASGTWRAGVHPRSAAWLLIANLVVSLLDSFVGPLADALRSPAPSYLLVAALGAVVMHSASRSGGHAEHGVHRSEVATTGRR